MSSSSVNTCNDMILVYHNGEFEIKNNPYANKVSEFVGEWESFIDELIFQKGSLADLTHDE